MDVEVISHLNLRKLAVNGELVVVLAEGSGHIINLVVWCVLFSKNGNLMVSAIHGRAHQIYRAGVHTNVFLIGMFLVDGLGYKSTVRSHNEASHLGIDGNISKSCRNQNLFVSRTNALTDGIDVVRGLVRTIRNSYAAG